MNSHQCWFCNQVVEYEDPKYRDFLCPECNVMNSIYDPDKPDWKPENQPTTNDEWLESEEEMGDLSNWSKENSKFIKIKSGESFEGVYEGYKEGVNMNGEPAIIYKFDGKEFKSSSAKLAESFDKIAKGTKVKISREGEGLQTKWEVETL